MAVPTYNGVGTAHATTPSWPSHVTGDMGILCVTSDTAMPTVPTGWTALPGASSAVASGVKQAIFYRVATSNAESSPTLAGGGTSLWGVIITIAAGTYDPSLPFNSCASIGTNGGTASPFSTTLGTFSTDNLCIYSSAWAFNSAGPLSSSEACSSLTSLTERYDGGASGLGGIVIMTGEKATATDIVPITHTFSTSSQYAAIFFAILPRQSGRGVSRGRSVNS